MVAEPEAPHASAKRKFVRTRLMLAPLAEADDGVLGPSDLERKALCEAEVVSLQSKLLIENSPDASTIEHKLEHLNAEAVKLCKAAEEEEGKAAMAKKAKMAAVAKKVEVLAVFKVVQINAYLLQDPTAQRAATLPAVTGSAEPVAKWAQTSLAKSAQPEVHGQVQTFMAQVLGGLKAISASSAAIEAKDLAPPLQPPPWLSRPWAGPLLPLLPHPTLRHQRPT